jgi:TubC N-terminal docking domain
MARGVTALAVDLDSVPGLLHRLRAEGFELALDGDRLRIRPAGRVTPELREAIHRHKAELLRVLAPVEYVMLRGGLTLPLPALQLAWNLEERGFRLGVTPGGEFVVNQQTALTEADRLAIERWRGHLAAIAAHQAPTVI